MLIDRLLQIHQYASRFLTCQHTPRAYLTFLSLAGPRQNLVSRHDHYELLILAFQNVVSRHG